MSEHWRASITDSPTLADESIPMLPVIIDASSDNMSPKILFVTIVSNCDTGNSVGQHTLILLNSLEINYIQRNKPV